MTSGWEGLATGARTALAILLIEDSPTDALFVREALRTADGPPIELTTVSRLSAGMAALEARTMDAVVLDLNLPDSHGTETLERLRAAYPAVPLVVLTGNADLAIAARVLQRGVQDYLVKDINIGPALVRSVRFAIERHRFTMLLEHQARALQESESRLRSVIESDQDALLIVGESGEVCFANPAAHELFETPVTAGPDALRVPVTLTNASEQEFVRRDGMRCFLEPRISRLSWEGRSARLVSLRDVTPRKLAEQETERARRLQFQLKDRFLSHISHELRTPLAVVREFLDLLGEGTAGDLNDEQGEYVGIMVRNVDALNCMIEDLLEVTRAQNGKLSIEPERIPVAAFLERMVSPLIRLAHGRGLDLDCHCEAGLPDVSADPLRFAQVLENLIGNAIKFTPSGGCIAVQVRRAASGDHLEFLISDTGPGIPPEQLELIFDELHQVGASVDEGRRGLGMGLYLARQLVERMGGRLAADSEPGRGSTFRFTLPVIDHAAPIHALLASRDDRALNAHVLRVELRTRGRRPLAAGDDMVCRAARRVLREALRRDSSWWVPREPRQEPWREPLFAVVVLASGACNECLTAVREALARCPGIAANGLECVVELGPAIPIGPAVTAERGTPAFGLGAVEASLQAVLSGSKGDPS